MYRKHVACNELHTVNHTALEKLTMCYRHCMFRGKGLHTLQINATLGDVHKLKEKVHKKAKNMWKVHGPDDVQLLLFFPATAAYN